MAWSLAFILLVGSTTASLQDNEKTRYFNQSFDHFNAETQGVWKQRYYVNTTYFKQPSSPRGSPPPLFFIPGGEWSLGPNKGILYGMAHDLAKQHGGLMATVEHRFYGESLPFGPNESFVASADRIGLLTIEQAMADYSLVIKSILEEYDIKEAPVVALGGSYSGKLSAYMRLKYPFLISVALASSAPIYLDSVGMTDQYAYYDVVEKATAKIRPKCPAAVKAAFTAYAATTSPTARKEALGLCNLVSRRLQEW
jgi:pimeloyl-ACP methyl ester carboxylesterase